MENHVLWAQKSSCFDLFRDGKYGLFWSKRWWKVDIFLVLLNFPWYFRTCEIWFFVQCSLLFRKNLLAFIRPIDNSLHSNYDPTGVKLLHGLRLDFPIMLMFFRNWNHGTLLSMLPQICHLLHNELNCINSKFNKLESD